MLNRLWRNDLTYINIIFLKNSFDKLFDAKNIQFTNIALK